MGENRAGRQSALMGVGEPRSSPETAFDRLEAKVDALIERYERLRNEHSQCSEQLADREGRIRQLEEQLEGLELQRDQVRSRLDALLDKLNRFA